MKKYILVVCLVLLAACASTEKRNSIATEPEESILQSSKAPEYSSNVFIRRYQQMLDARKQSTGEEPNFAYKAGTFLPSVLMTAILYPFAAIKAFSEDD